MIKKLILVLFLIFTCSCPSWAANYFVDSTTGSDADNGTTMDLAWATLNFALESGSLTAGDYVWGRRVHSENLGSNIVCAYDGTASAPIYVQGWPRPAIPNTTITAADWTNGSRIVDNVTGITPDREKHTGRTCTGPDGKEYFITAVLVEFTVDGMAGGAEFTVGSKLTNNTRSPARYGKSFAFTDNLDTTGTLQAVVDSGDSWLDNDNVTDAAGGDAELSSNATSVGFVIDREYAGSTVTGVSGKFQIEADEDWYDDMGTQYGFDDSLWTIKETTWDADAYDLASIDLGSNYKLVMNAATHHHIKNLAITGAVTLVDTDAVKFKNCLFYPNSELAMLQVGNGVFLSCTDSIFEGTSATVGDAWVEVAPQLGAETQIWSLAVYNNKLYGGTNPNSKLYEWNDSNAWVEVAPQLGAETYIYSLAVYNNKLYGGTALNGKLYEWNDSNAWVEVAPQLGAETQIFALAVYNNKLYGGTGLNGKLYEWNDSNAWVEVAPQLGAETRIFALAVYNNKLYGGTGLNGKLYEWNDSNAWVEVAPQLGAETRIFALAVYNNKLYGGTGLNGKLYEWNDSNAWVEVAPKLGAETYIWSLAVYNNKLYGGTNPNSKLYEWNDSNAWVEVAPQLGAETYIYSLAVYNNKLYGGTALNGKLYEWNSTLMQQHGIYVSGVENLPSRLQNLSIYNCNHGIVLYSPTVYLENVNIGSDIPNLDDDLYVAMGAYGRDVMLDGTNGYLNAGSQMTNLRIENYQKVLGDHKAWFAGGTWQSAAVTDETPNKKLSDIIVKLACSESGYTFTPDHAICVFTHEFQATTDSKTYKYWVYNNTGETLNNGDAKSDIWLEAEYVTGYDDTSEYVIEKAYSTENTIADAADADDWDYLSIFSIEPAIASKVRIKCYVSYYNADAADNIFIDPAVVIE